MSSGPSLHAPQRLSAVEACRILAGEVWRRERKLDDFQSGGLNTEGAVRHRLKSIAMALHRSADLEEKVALHAHSIDWLNADPLSILVRSEGLLDRQCRDSYPSVDALVRERSLATQLALRLLVLQSIAGRLGRWAVRADEIPDARIALARYRDLGEPKWSQFCRLTADANAAFERAEYAEAAAKVFDADRLVRTPASLQMASVALSREADFIGALWTIRVCLLEPEESFESPAALQDAKTQEARLREIVEGRAGDSMLSAPEVLSDIVDEGRDVLGTQSAQLPGKAPLTRMDRSGERHPEAVMPMPVLLENQRQKTAGSAQSIFESDSGMLLVYETYDIPFSSADEVRYVPVGSTVEVEVGDVLDQIPPEQQLRHLRDRAMRRDPRKVEAALRAISAAADLDPEELTLRDASLDELARAATLEQVTLPYRPFPVPREVSWADHVDPHHSASLVRASDLELESPSEGRQARIGREKRARPQRSPGQSGSIGERTLRGMSEVDEETARSVDLDEFALLDEVDARRKTPRASTRTTERIVRHVVVPNRPETPDTLTAMPRPMGQHTRETALAALDREESAISLREPAARTSSVERVYEVTQIVRARHAKIEVDQEPQTEKLSSRSPLDPR